MADEEMTDEEMTDEEMTDEEKAPGSTARANNFLEKIRRLANDANWKDVQWQPSGDGIIVTDFSRLSKSFESFKQTMRRWGFQKGPSHGTMNNLAASVSGKEFQHYWRYTKGRFTRDDTENERQKQRASKCQKKSPREPHFPKFKLLNKRKFSEEIAQELYLTSSDFDRGEGLPLGEFDACNGDGVAVAPNESEEASSRKQKKPPRTIDIVNEDRLACGEGNGKKRAADPMSPPNRFWSAVHQLLEAHHHRLRPPYGRHVEMSMATRAFKKFADQLHYMLAAYVVQPLPQNQRADGLFDDVESFMQNGFETSLPRDMQLPKPPPASHVQKWEEEAYLYSASKIELKRTLQDLLFAFSEAEMENKKGKGPAAAAAADALSSHLELAHKMSFCRSRRPQRHGGGGFDGGNDDDDDDHDGSDNSGGTGDRKQSDGSDKKHYDSDDDSDEGGSKGDEKSGDGTPDAAGMGANSLSLSAMQSSVSEAKIDYANLDKVEGVTHDDAKCDDSGVSSSQSGISISSSSSSSSTSKSSFEMVDRRALPRDFSPLQLVEQGFCLDGSDNEDEKNSPDHIEEGTRGPGAPSRGQTGQETRPVSSPRRNLTDLLIAFAKKLCQRADDDSYPNICWGPENDEIIVKDVRLMENYEAFSYFMRMCGFENGEPPRGGESLIEHNTAETDSLETTRRTDDISSGSETCPTHSWSESKGPDSLATEEATESYSARDNSFGESTCVDPFESQNDVFAHAPHLVEGGNSHDFGNDYDDEEEGVHVAFATLTVEKETTSKGDSVSIAACKQPDLGLHDAGHSHSSDGASGKLIVGESVAKDGVDTRDGDYDYDDENECDNGGNLGWSKEASATGVVVRDPTFHHMPPKHAAAKPSTEGNDADDGNNGSEKGWGDNDDDFDYDDDNYDDNKDDDNNKHVMTATAAAKSGDDATSSRSVLHNKGDAKVTNDEDDQEQGRGRDSSFSSCVSVSSRDLTAASGWIGNDNEDCSVRDLTEAVASTVEKKMSASSHNAMQSSDNASVSQDDEENDDLMEKMSAFQLDEEDQFDNVSEMEFEDFPDISTRADSRGRNRDRHSTLPASPWSSLKKYVGGKVWRNRSRQRGDDSSSVVTATTATNTITTGALSIQMDLLAVGEETESWGTFIPSMSTSRICFAGVMLREEGKIVVMGGLDGSTKGSSSVESIFPQDSKLGTTPRWTTMPSLARPRSSFGAAIVTTRLATTTATLVPSSIKGNDYPPSHHQCRHIVVAGGVIDECLTERAEVFNLSTNQWTDLPPLQVKRGGCAVTSLYSSNIVRGDDRNVEDCGGRVYVVGGWHRVDGVVGGVRHDTVEWLDVSAALQGGKSEPAGWRYLPSKMKRRRSDCAAVMVESSEGGVVSGSKSHAVEGNGDASLWGVQLVVVGGGTKRGITNAVECFDFGRGQWRDLPRMTTRRVGCAAVAIGCRIFVVGGSNANFNFLATAEYFDFGTNCWTRLAATMSVPRWACAAVVMTDKGKDNHDVDDDNDDNVCHQLVVLGGHDSQRRTGSVEILEIRAADAAKQAVISSATTSRPPTTSPPIDDF